MENKQINKIKGNKIKIKMYEDIKIKIYKINNPKRKCNFTELCTKVTITLNSGSQIDLIQH